MNVREAENLYLEYCEFRRKLNNKTINAYRIDLKQYFDFIGEAAFDK